MSSSQPQTQMSKVERDTLLKGIKTLGFNIQELEHQNSVIPTSVSKSETIIAKSLVDILQQIYALGPEIQELEPQNFIQMPSITKSMDNIAKHLQVLNEQVVYGTTDDGIVHVNPKPTRGVASTMLDVVFLIMRALYYGKPLPENPVLSDNFAPIRKETAPTQIEQSKISNPLPVSLNGMMVRNGPNPQFDPLANYMWLDGDSMLHAIRFKDGQATYVSRYLQTSRFKQEKFFGKSEFLQYGDLVGKFGLLASLVQYLKAKLGVLDMSYGWGNGDTGLVYHAGWLMALVDFDKPYAVHIHPENGDLETVGINNYNNRLNHNITPHPKRDPSTGELFTFGSSYTSPYATYSVILKDGSMGDPVNIENLSGPSYMHDFGITKNYAVFMDNPYYFSLEDMVKHDEWVYSFDASKKSRFGIMPRYAKDTKDIKWFEFDIPFFIFHNGNAWEDGDEVVLISCLMDYSIPSKRNNSRPKITHFLMMRAFDNYEIEIDLPKLTELRFNMRTYESTRKEISSTYCDYPKINESYIGRKLRYVYTSKFYENAKIPAIVKFDLQATEENEIETTLEFEANRYGSEVVFVPRTKMSTTEDDGYLITFVHDEQTSKSYAYVIDALNMKEISQIELPERVPYGFHAVFVTEDEIQQQKKSLTA